MKQKNVSVNDDYTINKILVVIVLAFAAMLSVIFFDKNVSYGLNVSFIFKILLPVLCTIFGLMTVGGCVLSYLRRNEPEKESLRILSGRNIALVSALLTIASAYLLKDDFTRSVKVLYVLIPALSLLYIIYHIYQREFFIHSVVCAVSAALMYLLKNAVARGDVSRIIFIAVVFSLFIAITFAIILLIRQNDGAVSINGRMINLVTEKVNYKLLNVTFAVAAVLFFAALIVNVPAFAYYFIIALAAYLIALAGYFTTKLL